MASKELIGIYKACGVSKREADALTWALHLEEVLDGAACATGRALRIETMRKLEVRGFVTEKWAVMVDGDGFNLEPERERRCFALTETGRALAKEIKQKENEFAKAALDEQVAEA